MINTVLMALEEIIIKNQLKLQITLKQIAHNAHLKIKNLIINIAKNPMNLLNLGKQYQI